MAANGNFGRNHTDDDVDGIPGNSYQSPEYARRYDPYGENTNLPELLTMLGNLHDKQEAEERARLAARTTAFTLPQNVYFKQEFGKFIIPKENTWAAHAQIVCNDQAQLGFSPMRFPIFDAIIADRAGIPALYDTRHRDYAKYEPMRTNLEVLRNDIIGFYLHDGSFDPGDERYIPHITAIAETLGNALGNDRWGRRVFGQSFSVELANVEAVGAAEMYRFLRKQQQKNTGILGTTIANLRSLIALPDRNWNLPPADATPFGPAGLAAPAPLQADGTSGVACTKNGRTWQDKTSQQQSADETRVR